MSRIIRACASGSMAGIGIVRMSNCIQHNRIYLCSGLIVGTLFLCLIHELSNANPLNIVIIGYRPVQSGLVSNCRSFGVLLDKKYGTRVLRGRADKSCILMSSVRTERYRFGSVYEVVNVCPRAFSVGVLYCTTRNLCLLLSIRHPVGVVLRGTHAMGELQ